MSSILNVIMKKKKIVMTVFLNKGNNQKLVTIPQGSDIEPGDQVYIKKAEIK